MICAVMPNICFICGKNYNLIPGVEKDYILYCLEDNEVYVLQDCMKCGCCQCVQEKTEMEYREIEDEYYCFACFSFLYTNSDEVLTDGYYLP